MVTAEYVRDNQGDTIEVFRNVGDALIVQICEQNVYASVTLTRKQEDELVELLQRIHAMRKE